MLIPPVLEGARELVADLLVDLPRDRDAPGLRELLQSGRYVDLVAVHITILLDDDVAEVDADANLERCLLRALRPESLLDSQGAPDGLHRALELNQEAISGGLEDPSVMLLDLRLDYFTP
jgi:hypothetical protein